MHTTTRKRIGAIDLLSGVAMVIMALAMYNPFHCNALFFDPSDLGKTNAALFWTQFILHFCALVLVFPAGTSAFL